MAAAVLETVAVWPDIEDSNAGISPDAPLS